MFSKKSTKELVQGGKKAPKDKKATNELPPAPQLTDNAEGTAIKAEPSALLHKSRYLLGALCIVLAVLISFVLLPRVYNQRAALTNVVTLRTTVEAGTTLTSDMLSVSEVGAFGLPEGVLKDITGAIGMVAAEPLYAGEMVWRDRLVSELEYSATQKTERPITKGCLVTLEVPSVAAGGAGILHAGDVVDIYKIAEAEDGTYEVFKCLEQVQIYDVLNESLNSMSDEPDTTFATNEPVTERRPGYVIFDVTESQAIKLIGLAQDGMLHMTKPYTGG